MQLDVNGPSICDQPMIDEIDETYRNAYPAHEPAKVVRMTPQQTSGSYLPSSRFEPRNPYEMSGASPSE